LSQTIGKKTYPLSSAMSVVSQCMLDFCIHLHVAVHTMLKCRRDKKTQLTRCELNNLTEMRGDTIPFLNAYLYSLWSHVSICILPLSVTFIRTGRFQSDFEDLPICSYKLCAINQLLTTHETRPISLDIQAAAGIVSLLRTRSRSYVITNWLQQHKVSEREHRWITRSLLTIQMLVQRRRWHSRRQLE
jgi:hypothetical protein